MKGIEMLKAIGPSFNQFFVFSKKKKKKEKLVVP